MSCKVRLMEDGSLDEEPLTLKEIAYQKLCNNLDIISSCRPDNNRLLNAGIVLPNEICDGFLENYQRFNRPLDDNVIKLFEDTQRTSLKIVNLRNSTLSSIGLETLMRHKLFALSMWYCDMITVNSHHLLAHYGDSLRSLELGISSHLLQNAEPNEKEPVDFQLTCPHLRRLVLNGVVMHHRLQFAHLHDLGHLDLTSCVLANFSLEALVMLPNLHTLILFNVWPIANQLHAICCLRRLCTLDISISSSGNGHGTYDLPDQTLEMLMDNLRHLTHLDISGTNLAGNGVATKESTNANANTKMEQQHFALTDIPGLASRTQRPLQFLGLYHTAHWACKRHDIPALEVAGDTNEQQILTAARYYHDRPVLLTRVLNDLYHLFRFENCRDIHTALDAVLSAMDRHLKFKHMQISGSATLFYIVKGRERSKFGTLLRNHIIRTLLNGMEMHLTDDTMLRNGYLTLTQFHMPADVLFEYERLIKILLHGVSKTEQEGFVQRIAIYLLNTLACQVDGRQKLFLGEMGVVSNMLTLIKDRLTRSVFDDVMEVAWSTMWNVTDETAINCKRFLIGRGMEYFLKCLHTFPDRDELLRNMMGLLGNVAEVKWLRPQLMTQEFIEVFARLLDSLSDGIEVSYNAAGVLAHIASDGADAWTIKSPSREHVLDRMVAAIQRWNIKSERNINYRSFEPILSLVRCYETPQCQHWAVWALANLTQVYPEKYCQLVEQENGIQILNELIEHESPYSEIKRIARLVIEQCDSGSGSERMVEG
ncbi:protein zer-1 homolog isoform X2 [Drosophila guanche]|uniref:Protein zer-1 homolog n=1 Tax=Drosophila guanche TaxID=7266 RepID=A0A3B0KGJ9_DROGU|nr:protein zer-1 homolog isoform X2 [Drosophila guanche]SPP84856.1 blast:Protein zer-1 homolog [Drosophila guanche]